MNLNRPIRQGGNGPALTLGFCIDRINALGLDSHFALAVYKLKEIPLIYSAVGLAYQWGGTIASTWAISKRRSIGLERESERSVDSAVLMGGEGSYQVASRDHADGILVDFQNEGRCVPPLCSWDVALGSAISFCQLWESLHIRSLAFVSSSWCNCLSQFKGLLR